MRELGNGSVPGKRGSPAGQRLVIHVTVITQPAHQQNDNRKTRDEDHHNGDRGVKRGSEVMETGAAGIRVSEQKVIRKIP
jgi:hypothetical protein